MRWDKAYLRVSFGVRFRFYAMSDDNVAVINLTIPYIHPPWALQHATRELMRHMTYVLPCHNLPVTSSPEGIRGHPQADVRRCLRFGAWTVCHPSGNDTTTGRATRPLLPLTGDTWKARS